MYLGILTDLISPYLEKISYKKLAEKNIYIEFSILKLTAGKVLNI
jgi:hypothetical protein